MKRIDFKLALNCIIFFSLTSIGTNPLQGQIILVDSGAEWKYLDDGSDQGTSWRNPSFNDAGWATGTSQFGYGDGDEATVISYGSNPKNKYITYYFRHSFNLPDLSQYLSLNLELLRDDGAVVYLNGIEIERSNMPAEPLDYLTFASSGAGEDEDTFFESFKDLSNLVAGTNVLAVEVHQRSTTSSDVSFDLKLATSRQFPDVARKAPNLIYSGNNTEMQVLWQLYFSHTCTIEWGTDTQYSLGSVQTNEYGDDHQHTYTIKNLIPGTKYYYRVTVNQGFYTGSFWSAPNSNATSIKFFVYGDTRSYPATHDQVAADMVATYLGDEDFQTFVLSTGDLVSEGDIDSFWDNRFFNSLYPNIQEMLATLPYQSCRGNHEDSGVLFTKYFPYPFVAGHYWSFDYGFAHFVVVDQYTSYYSGSAQLAWIENDLASRSKSWNFIFLHEPGWSAGTHGNNLDVQSYIQPLCEQYNVHVVFAGHNHYYARAIVNNVHYITTGGGGAPLYDPDPGYPNIVASAKAHHFCKVEIDGAQLNITVVDTSGNIIDLFSIGDQSLPVELSQFAAYQEEKLIILEWVTESEVENLGFILERKESHNNEWHEIASYITCSEFQGQGSIPYRTEYRFEDNKAEIGKTYDYRLADVSYNGKKQYHSMITQIMSIPLIYKLLQNYPNPFNPETQIRFQLPQNAFVVVEIYDMLGQHIAGLTNRNYDAGYHSVTWDGKDLNGIQVTSGIYIYRIQAGEFQDVKKMILIK